jgi:hypothetical protein
MPEAARVPVMLVLDTVMVVLLVAELDSALLQGQNRSAKSATGTRAQREVPDPPFHRQVDPERMGKSASTKPRSTISEHSPVWFTSISISARASSKATCD